MPSTIDGLIVNNYSPYSLGISWNSPLAPNGIITIYEIRYREFTSTGPYNIANTTNTQYSIVGLIANTSYTIGVRAYTGVGPGEWTNIIDQTPLGKLGSYFPLTIFLPFYLVSSVQGLIVILLNASSVYVSWTAPTVSSISHYTLYYNRTIDNVLTLNLSNSSTSVVITDLTPTSTQYEFRISVTIGEFEGPISTFVRPGTL